MTNTHRSSSTLQQNIEDILIAKLNANRIWNLKPETLDIGNGANVQIDGYDHDNLVLCEVYAHVGKMKGAQPKKIATDILKMMLMEKVLGETHTKILCLACGEAKAQIEGRSWLNEACKHYNVEIIHIELDEESLEKIRETQEKQKMANA